MLVQNLGSRYEFFWDDFKVGASVSRIHERRDGGITAEVSFSGFLSGSKTPITTTQLNLLSTRSRRDLSQQLEQMFPLSDNWPALLEELCTQSLEVYRRGEPVIPLSPHPDTKPPEYLLKPLLIRNYPTIIFGDPGTAKSTIAVVLSQILTDPEAWDGYFKDLEPPRNPTNCLYLDYETDRDTIEWTLTSLGKGMDIPLEPTLNYRHCTMPLSQDVEQIKEYISEYNVEVVIIDSLGLACGGEVKEAEGALNFFSALRQLKKTSLILAHTAKNPETKRRSIFGSVFFEAQARSVFEIKKVQESGENELDIALFHRKPAPFEKLHSPLGFHISYESEGMSISPGQPQTIEEFLKEMGTGNQIEEALGQNGPMTGKELSERLEISYDAVRQAIRRLKERKRIVKVGGKWGLAAEEE